MKQSILDFIVAWCIKEGKTEDVADQMLTKYNEDAEFWHKQLMWDLYDSIKN